MANILPYVKKSLRLHLDAIKENKTISQDKEYFKPNGIQAFYGEQGSGKTLTLIHVLANLKKRYPKALIVSNIKLKNYKEYTIHEYLKNGTIQSEIKSQSDNAYISYQSLEEYELVNRHIQNDKFGVILVTDEYQNYFSNQDSRTVPPWVLEQSAQNRKQRRIQLVTSQDYDQIVKAVRRRSDIAFKCRTYSLPATYGAIFSVYWAYDSKKLDFDNNGAQNALKPLKMGFYFHSQKLRDSYDTFQLVVTGNENPDIYTKNQNNIVLVQKQKIGRIKKPVITSRGRSG